MIIMQATMANPSALYNASPLIAGLFRSQGFPMSVLDKIKEVRMAKPTDHVIQQLKELVANGELKPGDLLPGERELAAKFNLGRGYIREALKTFELYGIFKSIPGRGTIVSNLSLDIYNDFLNNIVRFGVDNHLDLMDVREMLEPSIAYRAALHASDKEVKAIGKHLKAYRKLVDKEQIDLEVETKFHLEIANAAHNRLISIIMGIIIPELAKLGAEIDVLGGGRLKAAFLEHERVYKAIVDRDPDEAQRAMQYHIDKTKDQYGNSLRMRKKMG